MTATMASHPAAWVLRECAAWWPPATGRTASVSHPAPAIPHSHVTGERFRAGAGVALRAGAAAVTRTPG
jgi:hypothetical protein